ncbi:MAG: hypothetical protein FWH20_04770 [Oscillospiraceae bacterium]|nr:hypothetical protein [Oscillospiraceae bacterium]
MVSQSEVLQILMFFYDRFFDSATCDISYPGGFLDVANGGPYSQDFYGFRSALQAELYPVFGGSGAIGSAFAMNTAPGVTALPYGKIDYPMVLQTKPLNGSQRDAYLALKETLEALTEQTGEEYTIGIRGGLLGFTGTAYDDELTGFVENTIINGDVMFDTVDENMSSPSDAPTHFIYGNVINLFSNGGQIQAQFWRQRFGSYINSRGEWTDFGYDSVYADAQTALTSQSIVEIARAADANKKATLTFKVDVAEGIFFGSDNEFHQSFGAYAGSTTALSRAAYDTFVDNSRRADGTWWIDADDPGWSGVNTNLEWGYSTTMGTDIGNAADNKSGRVTEFTYEFGTNSKEFDGMLAQMYNNMKSENDMCPQNLYYLPDDAYIMWTYTLEGTKGGWNWNFDGLETMNSGWIQPRGTGNTAMLIGRVVVTDIILSFSDEEYVCNCGLLACAKCNPANSCGANGVKKGRHSRPLLMQK